MFEFFTIITALVLWHFVADVVLQSDFIAKHKSPDLSLEAIPWYYVMAGHAAAHALGVFLIAGPLCAIIEFITHFFLDTVKCLGGTSIHIDQACHIIIKVLIAAFVVAAMI